MLHHHLQTLLLLELLLFQLYHLYRQRVACARSQRRASSHLCCTARHGLKPNQLPPHCWCCCHALHCCVAMCHVQLSHQLKRARSKRSSAYTFDVFKPEHCQSRVAGFPMFLSAAVSRAHNHSTWLFLSSRPCGARKWKFAVDFYAHEQEIREPNASRSMRTRLTENVYFRQKNKIKSKAPDPSSDVREIA